MDRQYIDDHHIVARYLADRLSTEEREEFEAYYLEHPEVVKEMEALARFKVGLSDLQRSGELDTLIHRQNKAARSRVFAAAALIAAIAISIAFFTMRQNALQPLAASPAMLQASDGNALIVRNTYRILRTRSTSVDALVHLPPTAQAIELEILPEHAGESGRYRVSLTRMEGVERRAVAELERLHVDENGFVKVYLDSRTIQPGTYLITLANDAHTNEQASQFTLRFEDGA